MVRKSSKEVTFKQGPECTFLCLSMILLVFMPALPHPCLVKPTLSLTVNDLTRLAILSAGVVRQ